MEDILAGRVHKFGDDINTDYIIAGKYTKTLDFSTLAEHVFEDIAPGFAQRVTPGDIIAAGSNFGCGSSRDQAPIAIKHAGIGAILAKSYSRIFFRNAINQGIPAFLCDTDALRDGDRVIIRLEENRVELPDRRQFLPLTPLSPVMLDILRVGGLVEYLKKNGTYVLERQHPTDDEGRDGKDKGSKSPCARIFSRQFMRNTQTGGIYQ